MGPSNPFFLIHETSGRFTWSFGGDFTGFLAMDAVVDIAGALVLDLSEALGLENLTVFSSMKATREDLDSGEFIYVESMGEKKRMDDIMELKLWEHLQKNFFFF